MHWLACVGDVLPQVGMVVMVIVHRPLPHQVKVEEIFGTKECVYCFLLRLDA